MQKDIHIQKLQAQLNIQSHPQAHKHALQNLFIKYEHHFKTDEIKLLRSIGKGERYDSTFVTKCVHFLHGGPLNIINRVVIISNLSKGKTALSPDKVEIASNMLHERLAAEGVPDEISFIREARFKKLLNNAITNARRATTNSKNESLGVAVKVEHQVVTNSNIKTPPIFEQTQQFVSTSIIDLKTTN